MTVAGKFEKVSKEQFFEDYERLSEEGERLSLDEKEAAYEAVSMPCRATEGSAGYDIVSPIEIKLSPGESISVPTGLRVRIKEGWFLMIVPKSGLGTTFRFQLNNTIGIIDADYYGSPNEGHIMMRMTNDSKDGKELYIQRGRAYVQGLLVPFGIVEGDDAEGERVGGFGSTDAEFSEETEI